MTINFDTNQKYEPGVCNIGPQERRQRLFGGVLAFIITIIGWALIIVLSLPDYTKLLLFFPLFGGFVGIFQYTDKFCVAFAALARYHME